MKATASLVVSMSRTVIDVFFSRLTVALTFWTISLLASFQEMLPSFGEPYKPVHLGVGSAALAACSLPYIGAAGFMSSWLARGEKGYRSIDWIGIISFALLLVVRGLALMMWSEFTLHIFGVEISGIVWVLLGACSAAAVVRAEDALDWI
jgi:hypothetical protein